MPGRERYEALVRNLPLLEVSRDRLLVKGCVPGVRRGLLELRLK